MSLSLYQDNLVADAWHHVQAPGGYEWWYFDAQDTVTDTQVVAIFLDGFIWHPEMIRRYEKFAKRPTKNTPPFPSEYPCVYFCIYRDGKILQQFITQYPPSEFAAMRDVVDVRIGPNRLLSDENGRLLLTLTGKPWTLTRRGPITHHDQTLSAELCFTPKFNHTPIERSFLSKSMTGADHRWVLANPLCSVAGTILLRTPEQNRTIEFTGLGYHDHNFGTAPLGPGLHRWVWGRVLFDDQVYSFHYALPKDARLPHEPHLIHGDARQLREMPMQKVTAEWTCHSRLLLKYPKRIGFDDALVMTNPKVIDDTPFYLRVVYDAVALGKRSKAFCEVAYPHRLRWPLFGRMIEMSIDKRG